ncbi:peptidase [Xanthomonas phage pXoo2106]|uniref:Peptidase n=1 Tax=Xanthomonas phage pXoo2106 TaxID=2970483 RepID=A0AAX3C1A2_9CAUD|nr:peptidase [Xanthomonas phage pXoo2106]
MTTIAWDGKHLWADSQATQGDHKHTVRKILPVSTPTGPVLLGVTGDFTVLRPVLAALKAGEDYMEHVGKSATVLVVKDGALTVTTGKQQWVEEAPYFDGSGKALALGAYHASKSVAKAMAAAIAHDVYSSGPIVKLKAPVRKT